MHRVTRTNRLDRKRSAHAGEDCVGDGNQETAPLEPTERTYSRPFVVGGQPPSDSRAKNRSGSCSAQRLVNGNTLITEGADGRLFEVTTAGDIVWEYVSPYFTQGANRTNRVYRAYRVPYAWVPQLERPTERAVVPPGVSTFRLPAP